MESVLSVFLCFLCFTTAAPTLDNQVTVRANVGDIIGVRGSITQFGHRLDYTEFNGIPYAEPPVGDRRFAKPVKKMPFSQPFNATLHVSCPQDITGFPNLDKLEINEDCLCLDIFVPGTPSASLSLPVMIYLHGGGFQWGSKETYRAPGFAASNNVIYVAINYRVSAFGFLANPDTGLAGNYGLWDQHFAIRWVHDNILAFGGDPQKITLFGQSAGAASVLYQGMYEGNNGLIKQLIAMSGSSYCSWSHSSDQDAKNLFTALSASMNCTIHNNHNVLNCLRTAKSTEIQTKISAKTFVPTVDGDFVKVSPDQVFNSNLPEAQSIRSRLGDLNMIIGVVNCEAGSVMGLAEQSLGLNFSNGMSAQEFESSIPLVLSLIHKAPNSLVNNAIIHEYYDWTDPTNRISTGQRFLQMASDGFFYVPVRETTIAHATEGRGRTYFFEFDHRPSFSNMYSWVPGANHADELGFLFGFPPALMTFAWNDALAKLTPDEIALSEDINRRFTSFARNGNPNVPGGQSWPQFTLTDKDYVVFETGRQSYEIRQNPRADASHFWEVFLPKLTTSATRII